MHFILLNVLRKENLVTFKCTFIYWLLLTWIFINFQKAPIDPFTRESSKPSASQGVPLGGMGCVYLMMINFTNMLPLFLLPTITPYLWFIPLFRTGSISRGFRGEFKHWQITPGSCDTSPVMENQFSVTETFYPAKTCYILKYLPFSQFHFFSLLLIHIVMDPNLEHY